MREAPEVWRNQRRQLSKLDDRFCGPIEHSRWVIRIVVQVFVTEVIRFRLDVSRRHLSEIESHKFV